MRIFIFLTALVNIMKKLWRQTTFWGPDTRVCHLKLISDGWFPSFNTGLAQILTEKGILWAKYYVLMLSWLTVKSGTFNDIDGSEIIVTKTSAFYEIFSEIQFTIGEGRKPGNNGRQLLRVLGHGRISEKVHNVSHCQKIHLASFPHLTNPFCIPNW